MGPFILLLIFICRSSAVTEGNAELWYSQPQYGDCSSPATGSSSTTTTSSSSAMTSTSTSRTPSTTSSSTVVTGESDLTACGQTCFDNMLAQCSALSYARPLDSQCPRSNADFSNGLFGESSSACRADCNCVLEIEVRIHGGTVGGSLENQCRISSCTSVYPSCVDG